MLLEPTDFGSIYHSVWKEMIQGDFQTCQSLIHTLQRLAESELETDQLAAKIVIQALAEEFHSRVCTQDLGIFENLERHQFEQLFMMVKPK